MILVKMHILLFQQGIHIVLQGKDKLPAEISTNEKDGLDLKAHVVIQLGQVDEVFREVANEDYTASL